MAQAPEIRGKTEQRVDNIVSALRGSSDRLSYEELQLQTGADYATLLYVLTTLTVMGHVERFEDADGPGRPRVFFLWKSEGARGVGPRLAR